MEQKNVRQLIPILLAVRNKVKAEKPIVSPREISIRCDRGSKLAKTAIVTEIEHFWHFGHFWKWMIMKQKNVRQLIPILLAVCNKVKAEKPIGSPRGTSFCCDRGSKLAKTAIVTEIEHFWYFWHFQKWIFIKQEKNVAYPHFTSSL